MRAIVQRVRRAEVRVEGRVIGACGEGLCVLVGVHRDDQPGQSARLADKIAGLRIFSDPEGKMNLALTDFPLEGGGFAKSVLAISNFTVYGDAHKNRRPSFIESAPFEKGREFYERFLTELSGHGLRVESGEFGADMEVTIVNDGPVTVIVDV